ncbi:MAG TPA: DUF6174 domain-containing protein [Chloroflexia bacterium]|jgi:hypothetical protein
MLAGALVAGLSLWAVLSRPPDHGTVNVSRSDYEAALRKWRSQRVEEYEMVVSYSVQNCWLGPFNSCGKWKLHVEGDKVAIVENMRPDIPLEAQAPLDCLRFLTIDNLFEEARKTINEGPFDYMRLPLDYMINFDDGRGYPRDIKRTGRQPNDGSTSSMAWHLGRYVEVHDLKVIRTLDK